MRDMVVVTGVLSAQVTFLVLFAFHRFKAQATSEGAPSSFSNCNTKKGKIYWQKGSSCIS